MRGRALVRGYPAALTARLDHAPSGWIEKASAIARAKSVAGRIAKFVARLQFDSWLVPSPAVLRGASGRPSRRLNWEAESWSVDLRVEETP